LFDTILLKQKTSELDFGDFRQMILYSGFIYELILDIVYKIVLLHVSFFTLSVY